MNRLVTEENSTARIKTDKEENQVCPWGCLHNKLSFKGSDAKVLITTVIQHGQK